jgi:hypothetical protein
MKIKIALALLFGAIAGWEARSLRSNPKAVIRVYNALQKLGFFALGKETPIAKDEHGTISEVTSGSWNRARAAVYGKVIAIARKHNDGDIHVNLEEPGTGKVLTSEISPFHPLAVPQIGRMVKAIGIVRFDPEHEWWELNPLFAWEYVSPP